MFKILSIIFLFVYASFTQPLMTAEDAIMLGLKNNFDIQIARNQEEIAQNNNGKALSGFLPTLDASANLNYTESEQETNSPFSFGNSKTQRKGGQLNLNWTLFDGFSMFVNQDQFHQLEKLGEYQARNIIESTVVAILSAYYNLVQQEQLLDVARNTLDISGTRLDKEKVRQELGSASSTDFWNAQVAYNNDNSTLINQELRRLIAQKELNILLGRDANTQVQAVKQIVIPDLIYSPEEILEFSKNQNIRLQLARQNKKVADNNISLKAAGFYPRVFLNASYAYSQSDVDSDSERFTEPVETTSKDGNIGLNLSFNLFNGLRDKIDWQNARIEAKNQELALRDQENKISATVQEKVETFYTRMALIELEEQNVIAAEKNLQLNQDRYAIGAVSSLEFRDAQVNLTRSQATLIVARYQARITRLEIQQLMGQWEIPE